MKKVIPYSIFLFVLIVLNLSMFLKPVEVKIKGSVSDNAGLFPADMKIHLWKKAIKLHHVKTDKFGNFEIIVPEEGEYSFVLSENNLYYYTQKDSNIAIPASETHQHNFKITINKQELKHKCTRLVEAIRHLEKNPGNISFKGITYARFPSNMNEFQLFFCTKVPHENLKKTASKVINDFYRFKVVSDTAYFSKYAQITSGYTDKCETRSLDFLTDGLNFYLEKNPEGFFEVINNYNNEQITSILKNLVRKQSKEQQEQIFGKLPSYNGRIHSLYTKLNSEKKSK
ncbi:MAG: hypothetical protein ACO3EE_08685 [Flavobacteriales bacterium]